MERKALFVKLREAGELLDAEPMPTEGRLLYHPELGVINDKGEKIEEPEEED